MKKINSLLFTLLFTSILVAQGNGYLGISMEKSEVEGVRISEILENGSAKTYGLKQNDIILEVNGIVVNTATELKKEITTKNWGETVELLLRRNGHSQLVKVTLGNRAKKVIYQVKRKKINNQYEWNFDNNTWITVEDGKAKKMVKLREDGSKVVQVITEGGTLPQEFSDLSDKMEIIEAIDARNAGKRFYPSITVYIKTYAASTKIKKNINPQLNVELKAFPNPSLGMFKFTFKLDNSANKNVTWEVIDIKGKKVASHSLNNFEGNITQSIDLTAQSAGVYLLKVIHNNELYTEKLVVK